MSETNREQITGRVDGSLRDRIAAVVHDYSVPIPMAELVADAVIEALGMTVERDGPPIVPPCHRYVTDWIASDE